MQLVEEEGAIGVQDVVGERKWDIVLTAWQPQRRWAWVVFVVAIECIKLLHHTCEAMVDISSGVVGDVIVVPEGRSPVGAVVCDREDVWDEVIP